MITTLDHLAFRSTPLPALLDRWEASHVTEVWLYGEESTTSPQRAAQAIVDGACLHCCAALPDDPSEVVAVEIGNVGLATVYPVGLCPVCASLPLDLADLVEMDLETWEDCWTRQPGELDPPRRALPRLVRLDQLLSRWAGVPKVWLYGSGGLSSLLEGRLVFLDAACLRCGEGLPESPAQVVALELAGAPVPTIHVDGLCIDCGLSGEVPTAWLWEQIDKIMVCLEIFHHHCPELVTAAPKLIPPSREVPGV